MRLRRLKLNTVDAVVVFKALASDTRAAILRALAEAPRNVSALSQMTGISQSATTKHIQQLEAAGLIEFEHCPGAQGTQKVCSLKYDVLNLLLNGQPLSHAHATAISLSLPSFIEVAGVRCLQEDMEGRIRARDTKRPAQMIYVNNSGTAYELFWLNDEGKRQSYGHLMPGSVVTRATFETHAWLLMAPDESVLGIFVPRQAVSCIVIGGPDLSRIPPAAEPEPELEADVAEPLFKRRAEVSLAGSYK